MLNCWKAKSFLGYANQQLSLNTIYYLTTNNKGQELKEKMVIGYNDVYKITEDGRVFSRYKKKTNIIGAKWVELSPVLDKGVGYYLFTLVHPVTKVRKNAFLHRLLAIHFISNPLGKSQVNHKDGNKTNNLLHNLEWVTPKENTHHAIRMGLSNPSIANSKSIKQISLETGECVQTYKSAREAHKVTGIAYQNISKVLRGLRKSAGGFYWEFKKVQRLSTDVE